MGVGPPTLQELAAGLRRLRLLGPNAGCDACGERAWAALTRTNDGRVLCYEHLTGRSTEVHHLTHTTTVRVPANVHRMLHAPGFDALAWFNVATLSELLERVAVHA